MHYNLTISGKVQGVFFRKSARDMARELGITGYAMNMPDGNVYIEAEGEQNKLDEFMVWCKKGPAGARVDKLESTRGEEINFDKFEIRYL